MENEAALAALEQRIISCRRCPRLIAYCNQVAAVKRRAYLDWEYWGKPVPAFGDPRARVLVIGLAPGAHGANRTGRMFTGDKSGDFLYRALHATGFASQPESRHREDGLTLKDMWITAAVRCAPPGNKPARDELEACRGYLQREIELLSHIQVVVALGRIAFDSYLMCLKHAGRIGSRSAFRFGHNVEHRLGSDLPVIVTSYHPSQQNTSTGKLTFAMLKAVFTRVRKLLD